MTQGRIGTLNKEEIYKKIEQLKKQAKILCQKSQRAIGEKRIKIKSKILTINIEIEQLKLQKKDEI